MTTPIDVIAKIGRAKTILRACGTVLMLWLVALIAEISVFNLAPNEMMGWGEKPSLRPDPIFGWRLIESKTTRLRWLGYDYVVTSNSLGFPGPEYPIAKSPSGYRIMTVGSGFTSAEGVDTGQAWPRVLEAILNRRFPNRVVEVLNFAVTGYGPAQYAALVEEFAPIYRPDAIIVAIIPNDLKKVMTPISKRVQGIGFDRPNPNGAFAILTCQHFLRSTKNQVRGCFYEVFKHRPNPLGYSLGQIWAFEKGQQEFLDESQLALEARLVTMKTAANELGCRLILLLIPASVQVCSPRQLQYFPKHIELSDSARFDMNQPQRRMVGAATRLGITYYDLRDAFSLTPDQCYYHPKNMHWTDEGHRAVAAFVASQLEVMMRPDNPQ